jgi:hypothetical protein
MALGMVKTVTRLALGAAILIGAHARADQWDVGVDADNGPGTDNAPVHGSQQVHDLGVLAGAVRDEDWFIAHADRFSSYEFVVDGMTGNLNLPPASVELVTATGTVEAQAIGVKEERVLSLHFLRAEVSEPRFVRVRFAACGSTCTAADTYRARLYDTTYSIPRFNNSGTQATVALIQNNTARSCFVAVFFFDVEGDVQLPDSQTILLAPHALHVLPVAGGAGHSGSARVVHECGYGGLSGKAVSIEPSTGFTFDTPMLPRPR